MNDRWGLPVLVATWVAACALHVDWLARSEGGAHLWGDAWIHLDATLSWVEHMRTGTTRYEMMVPRQYPWGVTLAAALLMRCTGPTYMAPLAVTQVAFLVLALGAWDLAGRRWSGVLAGVAVLLSPYSFLDGKRFMLDAPMAALLTLALCCWRRGGWWVVAGAVLGAAAGFCRFQASLYLVALLASVPWMPPPRRPVVLSILLALEVAALWAWNSLPEILPLVAVSRDGPQSWSEMQFVYARALSTALTGPALGLVALWGLAQRGQRWAFVYVAVTMAILCWFTVGKARFMAPLLPVLAAAAASALRGRRWATAALLLALALPWWPLPRVEVAEGDLERFIYTNNQAGTDQLVCPPPVTSWAGIGRGMTLDLLPSPVQTPSTFRHPHGPLTRPHGSGTSARVLP